jgi:hypothetical protein
MLRDIELEENEALNIERLLFLVNEQKKIYQESKDKKNGDEVDLDFLIKQALDKSQWGTFLVWKGKKNSDEVDLDSLIKQALDKSQWRTILVLLTSPCLLSQDRISDLAQYKDRIFSPENLKAKTSYGQAIVADSDFKSTNIDRLAHKKTGILSPQTSRFFWGKPAGALGRMHGEKFNRKESRKIFSEKNAKVLETIVRCLKLDSISADDKYLAGKAVVAFERLLNSYLTSTSLDKYNPLLLLFEVYALLVDKGFNQPLGKKKRDNAFNSFKTHMGSSKLGDSLGAYNHKYAIHIKFHADTIEFLATVIHEFTHAICKMIYGDTSTRYQAELNKLAKMLKQFCEDEKRDISDTLNFFDFYAEEKYAAEMFPRIVELYIMNPDFNAAILYNKEIANALGHIFSLFLRDLAEFKEKLLKLQKDNQWSRREISQALEIEDYKTFFSMLTPQNQSKINVWPQFMAEDEKLFRKSLEIGFPIFAKNKFKKDALMIALKDTNSLEPALAILQFLWEKKIPVPKSFNYNVQDKRGDTLLMRAIINEKEPGFIEWLVKEIGIDVGTSNPHTGKTALSYANTSSHKEILPIILTASNLLPSVLH